MIGIGAGLAALATPLAYLFIMFCIWATVQEPRMRWIALGAFSAVVIVGGTILYHRARKLDERVVAFEQACERNPSPTISGTLAGVDRVLRDYNFSDSRATRIGDNVAFPSGLSDIYLLSGFAPFSAVGERLGSHVRERSGAEPGPYAERYTDGDFRLAYTWRDAPRTPEGFEQITLVLMDRQTQQELATQPVLVSLGDEISAFPSLWLLPTRVYADRDRSCPSALELATLVRKVANRPEVLPQ
jgi:hypothetical protein